MEQITLSPQERQGEYISDLQDNDLRTRKSMLDYLALNGVDFKSSGYPVAQVKSAYIFFNKNRYLPPLNNYHPSAETPNESIYVHDFDLTILRKFLDSTKWSQL